MESSCFAPVYFVPTCEDEVAITFDDGPTPGVTEVMLGVLAKHGAKATFFMVGDQVRKHPELAKMVVDAGHEVGIHSDRHKRGMREWSTEELVSDFSSAVSAVANATGTRPSSVRTPFGNMCRSIVNACSITKLKYVGWSLSVKDWQGNLKGKVDKLVSMSIPGSIVLFHDGGRVDKINFRRTEYLLDALLESRNASFVTVSELEKKWDCKAEKKVGDKRLLGISYRKDGDRIEANAFFDPFDVLIGISYRLTCISNGSTVVESVDIAPMSNVTDWCQTVMMEASWPADVSVSNACSYSDPKSCYAVKLNLGCGKNVIPGWENLDIADKAVNGIVPWQWNQKLPYGDGTVELILIQHCTNHCAAEDFDKNIVEMKRVLKPGGKIVMKDADDRFYVWKQIGSHKDGGIILSTMSEPKIVALTATNLNPIIS